MNTCVKVWPIYKKFNKISANLCNYEKGVAIDESLRRSFGVQDATKRFNPSKPSKYGQQNQLLVGSDHILASIIPDLDQNSKLYQSCGELCTKLLPVKIHNTSIPIGLDNWYTSRDSFEYLIKLKFRFIGTLRKNRLGPFFGAFIPDVFNYKSQKSLPFSRRIYVYQTVLSDCAIDIVAYYDKKDKNPVIFVTNCQDMLKDYSYLPHQTQILPGNMKPAICLLNNS